MMLQGVKYYYLFAIEKRFHTTYLVQKEYCESQERGSNKIKSEDKL